MRPGNARTVLTVIVTAVLLIALAGCTSTAPKATATVTSSPIAQLGHGTVELGTAHYALEVTSCQRQGILLNISAHSKTGGVTFAAIVDVTHHNPNYFVYVPGPGASPGGTHYIGTGHTAGHPQGVTFRMAGKKFSGAGTFSVQSTPAPAASSATNGGTVQTAPSTVHGTVVITCGNIRTIAAPKPEATIQPAPKPTSSH